MTDKDKKKAKKERAPRAAAAAPAAIARSAEGYKNLVRDLAELLDETGLSEIEIEHQGLRARVSRAVSIAAVERKGVASASQTPAAAATSSAADQEIGDAVTAPMVGTVYLSPEPGAKPFVEAGMRVKKGQTLLIIEAMKTMNHIPAPREGVVEKILVSDGAPVEFGEPLLALS